MIKRPFAALFLLPVLLGCFSFPGGTSRTGETQTALVLSSVSGNLTVSGPYDIVLVPGSAVQARMPAAVLASIITMQTPHNNTISPRRNFLLCGQGTVDLLIGIDALSSLNINTTGSISTSNNLSKSQLFLILGGTVTGHLNVNVGSLNLKVTSPRNISMTGRVKTLKLEVTDLVRLDLRRLEMTDDPQISQPGYGAVLKL